MAAQLFLVAGDLGRATAASPGAGGATWVDRCLGRPWHRSAALLLERRGSAPPLGSIDSQTHSWEIGTVTIRKASQFQGNETTR